jgi:vancomycin resistance protein VanJ
VWCFKGIPIHRLADGRRRPAVRDDVSHPSPVELEPKRARAVRRCRVPPLGVPAPAKCFVRTLLALINLVYLLIVTWHFSQVLFGQQPEGSFGLLWELTLYFFLPAPFLLLAALLFRARGALFLALLPVALFGLLYGERLLPRTQPMAAGPAFRVMTFNAGTGGSGEAEAVLAAVQEAQPDLVATQEVQGRALQALRTGLAERYPYQAATGDVATFSAYPLLDATEFRLRGSGYQSQAMDVHIGDHAVRLTNVHLQRTGPRLGGRRSIVAFVRNYEPGLLEGQVTELLDRHVRPVNGAQLLTGDFNQTEWSRPYGMVAAVLGDSFREAGRGFGHTFPSAIEARGREIALPLVRIDYIFHSPDLVAQSARMGPDHGSDHVPVVADLAFKQ